MTNEEMIRFQKAVDLATGGLVGTKQLTEFLTSLIDKSAFLKGCRSETGIAKDMDLDHLGISKRILRKKLENTAPEAETGTLIRKVNKLTPENIIAYIQLTYKWMQKALGGNVNDMGDMKTVLSGKVNDLMIKQLANDCLDLFFNGDKESEDPFIQCIDGWAKKIKANADTHKVPYVKDTPLTDIFDAMIEKLPDDFMSDESSLRFFCNPKIRRAYKKQIAERNTALGDIMAVKNADVYYEDILVSPVWAIGRGEIYLSTNDNFAFGYGQDMLVERDKDIKKQNIDIVATFDAAANIVIADGMVVAYQE